MPAYSLRTRIAEGRDHRVVKDKLLSILVIVFSAITIFPIVLIIGKLISKGYKQINLDFFIKKAPDTYEAMTALNAGEIIPGGILNGITGTLLMVLMAALIAIPLGLLIGIFLYEHGSKKYAGLIRDISDILQGVPSIVLGLIAYFWVVKNITHGFSALAGSTALAIMMLPLIIRSTEETLKMIPDSIKEAGFALGVPYHKIILRVLIPTGFSGLLAGILLAISRIIGETAPLMLTALGSMEVNFNIQKPTSAVPLLIWEFYNDPNMVDLIWSSSLFLMALVLILNIVTKSIRSKK
ncbi:MAG: phosphate ABC transporter permease PstA [Bacteroidetes bacterium]|nr:phosphate ABC transporter permease PstA [Bacteroidota bacterium]MBT4411557.1 phosphate ABC transporter permease PstA [Bacteroidota bacterium]MBT7093969.1 phosphate ABC transporter permease PstA [Bacteroidota bacterium]MBT7465171.1 phosphate ABC transporter permease PstA [Bacteroidota bacterium]